MLELLFLLLPVAAGYGWVMGRNSLKQTAFKSKVSLSKQYSAGLNFLLSDQEEKAVEHLIEFFQVNADTLETHLALANLFRKRGEIDKAIEIHERLNSLELPIEALQKIQLELAKDYISAGMLDMAEKVLLGIELDKDNRDNILQLLVSTYQTMKEWRKSDALCQQYKNLSPRLNGILSHHCCELADEACGDDNVIKWYKKALKYDHNCVRALLALAQMTHDNGQYRQALTQYQQLLSLDDNYAPLLLDKMEQCYVRLDDKADFYQYLAQTMDKPNIALLLKYSAYMEQFAGADKALAFIVQHLQQKPNMRAIVLLLDLEAKTCESAPASAQFEQVKQLVSQYLADQPLFECRQCGLATKQHYWLCPSCQTWGNAKPAVGAVKL